MSLRSSMQAMRPTRWLWWSTTGLLLAAAAVSAIYGLLHLDALADAQTALEREHSRLPGSGLGRASRAVSLLRVVEVLVSCAVTGYVAFRGSAAAVARSLAVFLCSLTVLWSLAWFGAPILRIAGAPGQLGLTLWAAAVVAAGAAFVQFTSRFPRTLTDDDIVREAGTGLVAKALERVPPRLRPLIAPLEWAWRGGERGAATRTHPADLAMLIAAAAAFVCGAIAYLRYLTGLRLVPVDVAFLGLASRIAVATWALLATVAVIPLIRRFAGETTADARQRVTGVLALFVLAAGGAALLARAETLTWSEALALSTASAILANTAFADAAAAGRRFDWWMVLLLPVLVADTRLQRVVYSPGAFTLLALGTLFVVFLRVAARCRRQMLDWMARRRAARLAAGSSGGMPADVSIQTAARPRFGVRLRCRLLRPTFLWALVLLVPLVVLVAGILAAAVSGWTSSFTAALVALLLVVLAAGSPFVITVALMVRGTTHLRIGYAASDAANRRKVLWLVVGLSTAVAIVLFDYIGVPLLGLSPAASARIGNVVGLVIPPLTLLSVGVAVFYHGAVDPRLVLRRTSVYALLGLIAVPLYAVVENLFADRLADWFGLPESTGPLLAAGMVAAAMTPLRSRMSERVVGFIEHLFPGALLPEATEVLAVVAAVDIADDFATGMEEARLSSTRAAILRFAARHVAKRHRGEVSAADRDVMLIAYPDAASALRGVPALQAEFRRRCVQSRVAVVELRAGVHMGLTIRGGDGALFGPVVDVADELRRQAPPGSVLASEEVVRALGEKERASMGVTAYSAVVSPGGVHTPVSSYQVDRR